MPQSPLAVIYEDNHLLVINKPAGLATQGVAEGTPSVVTRAKEYLKKKHNKPGNVYLGVVSRLDATVTGLVVVARTSKAAARLAQQFQSGSVEKVYWALVQGSPEPPESELSHWLLKSDRERCMKIVPPRTRGAQHARLSYRMLSQQRLGTLVEVQLQTGRKHQIRAQLADIHCPILGDRKYGSRKPFIAEAIALHCVRLGIDHPTTGKRLRFEIPPPASWQLRDLTPKDT